MFGQGVSLAMSFSSYLSSVSNSFATLGDSSANATTKITTSIGAVVTGINLLKRTMEFSKAISQLGSVGGIL
jgi:hypothetical protein